MASEDSACSHILYAACHDTAYLSQLVPFNGVRDKVTLVQGAGWNAEFHKFNLYVTQFPTVFRWSDLPTAATNMKATLTNGSVPPKPKVAQKKVAQTTPLGPRHHDTLINGSMSPRGSVMESDGVSPTTNGFDTSNGINFGSKASSSNKSSQQLCKYFQKVYQYDKTLTAFDC
jgi:hypothetical protein